MNLALITDSTCDLSADELQRLGVERVPLYVNFKGAMHKDWVEISPKDIIGGVAAGADLPTTSQPSPEDFAAAYRRAADAGADRILVITISSELSGTYQSATIAAENAPVPVTVFDGRGASLGHGEMVRAAAALLERGASFDDIMAALKRIRDTNFVIFSVGTLEYLQKGGRIGRASAMLGSLLNIRPLLTVVDGKIEPLARARGVKKAQQEMVERFARYVENAAGPVVANLIHIQDEAAARGLEAGIAAAGVQYQLRGIAEIGAVVGSHVGPGTFGIYAHEDVL
jgi:DegV family protein with EDD domain